jgi:choline dehydrogenase-like flavoprotein
LDIQQTFINLGIPLAADPLNGDIKGCSFQPSTVDPVTQTRTYAASAYYQPNAHRENLKVAVSALVTRVILEKTDSGEFNATGVEVLSSGQKTVIKAKKEVIISTG